MSEGGMVYLIMVVVAFLGFASALLWAMISSGRPPQARAPEEPARDAARGHWSHGGAG